MHRDVQAEITQTISDNPVVLYMKGTRGAPMCGFSAAVVQILTELQCEFKDVDVLSDFEIREGIKQFAQWPTIPQLYVSGEFIGGCDIVRQMHAQGELQPLISKAAGKARSAS